MHARTSRGAVVSFLLAVMLAGCSSKGTSTSATALPRTEAELLAMKPAGTNALIVHVAGYGYGTIAATPDAGLTCASWDHEGPQLGQVCWQYVPIATSSVTLTATAGASSQFAGWYGPSCAATPGPSCSVPMSEDQVVGASFVPAPPGSNGPFLLSVDVVGQFPGVVTPSPNVGLTCVTIDEQTNIAQRCSALVARATLPTVVTLHADPGDPRHVLGGWGGSCAGMPGADCPVTMSKDVSVTVSFPLASSSGAVVLGPLSGSWFGTWQWTDSPTVYSNLDFELAQIGATVSGIAFTGIGNSVSGTFDGTRFDYRVSYTGRPDYDQCTATISPAPTGAQLRASCTWYVSNLPSRAYTVLATQHVCAAGRTACSGTCVPLQTDFMNCGACGVVCAAGQVCNAGQCTAGTAVDVSGTWNDVATLTVCGFSCGTRVGQIYTSPLILVSDGPATFHGTYFGVAVRGSVNGNVITFGYDNFATSVGPAQGQCAGTVSGLTMDLACDEWILSTTGLLLNGTTVDHATKP